jgi:hypothetical protein
MMPKPTMANLIKTWRVQRKLTINSPTHFATEREAQHYADDLNLRREGEFSVIGELWTPDVKLDTYPPAPEDEPEPKKSKKARRKRKS